MDNVTVAMSKMRFQLRFPPNAAMVKEMIAAITAHMMPVRIRFRSVDGRQRLKNGITCIG